MRAIFEIGDGTNWNLDQEKFMTKIDQLCIDTIRTLSMDAVQAANSGHPGAPMGLAPVAYALWQNILRFDPEDPVWPNRDRFVLSAGHASMLLYSLLHLTGVNAVDETLKVLPEPAVSMDAIKNFRQLNGDCPGHPEYETAGVEMTTGPLGQGVATSVGMAVAGQWMAGYFNRPDYEIVNYRVYALAGDGDLMEGLSAEAASLAGHLKLSNLCWIFDNNSITIDGPTDLTVSEDTEARFRAYGWEILRVPDANAVDALVQAYEKAGQTPDKPVLIIVDSHIAYGSPNKQDTSAAHGSPLGVDEIKLAKKNYGWPEDAHFLVPDGVREHFRKGIGSRGEQLRGDWIDMFQKYKVAYPDLALQFKQIVEGELPDGWDKDIPVFPADAKGLASRAASGKVLNAIGKNVPWLMGGSADLAPSNKTELTYEGASVFSAENRSGCNFHFGIREHAMAAIMNGMCLCGLRSYGGTFLVFSDYARPSMRLSALMELPVIYVYTHDSICVGEDGPTHQPIEHVAALRAMPNLIVIRPCDANETAAAWKITMENTMRPTALILSRQNLPTIDRTVFNAEQVEKGGYVLADCKGEPELLLMATGSEVSLCMEAWKTLSNDGVRCRLVSLPSWELFQVQPQTYRDSVLPPQVTARVAVEAGTTLGWERYTGLTGAVIGIDTFGASAPADDLMTHFGFTVDRILEAARGQLK